MILGALPGDLWLHYQFCVKIYILCCVKTIKGLWHYDITYKIVLYTLFVVQKMILECKKNLDILRSIILHWKPYLRVQEDDASTDWWHLQMYHENKEWTGDPLQPTLTMSKPRIIMFVPILLAVHHFINMIFINFIPKHIHIHLFFHYIFVVGIGLNHFTADFIIF